MKINEAFIIDYLKYKAGRPLKIKELAGELRIPSKEYAAFRSQVKSIIDSGRLVRLRRGKVGLPSEMNLTVGKIKISRSGYGSIKSESGEPIVINPPGLSTALDGDKVMVRIDGRPDKELYGVVIKIVERADKNIVGIFRRGKNFSSVIPDDKRFRRDIYIPNRLSKKAKDGQRVMIRVTIWEAPHLNPEGVVVEVLGFPGDPGVDMQTVIKRYNLPEKFPSAVEKAASKATELFSQTELKKRRDFSNEMTCTIDPADAKDFDDAISVVKTAKGYRLGVYIADVSFFVRDGTPLDKEAFARGTSVYLPGQVIPMLPEKLSSDLCSLRPNRKRLVYAVIMDISPKGKLLKWDITEGVIKSKARLSYEQVQSFFDNGVISTKLEKIAPMLTNARELATILSTGRMAQGSLDFDLPEAKIVLGKDGKVVDIGNRIRLESHRLVEEFMLLANKAVALHVFRLGQKMLYRVHDRPDAGKLEAFSYLMSSLGYSFPVSENMKPIQFARFIKKVKDTPEEEFVNELLLRAMKKAVYQPHNIGHFGLAFSHYTHFTSPIRRYPDLIVHRLLKKLVKGRYPVELNKRLDSILTNVGHQCSDSERNAEAAEREAVKIKQVAYMSEKIGESYHGVISGILNFGFFVRLDHVGVEGMVRLSTLDNDYYHYDERHFRLVGKRSGQVFKMGDPVKVKIMEVDSIRNQINLSLIESFGQPLPAGKKKRKRS